MITVDYTAKYLNDKVLRTLVKGWSNTNTAL